MVNSSKLTKSLEANPFTFYQHIEKLEGTNDVVIFPNLNSDAYLIVPAKNGPDNTYTYMANFLRNAPHDQIRELFHKIGKQALLLVSQWSRLWISTAGLGIYWLHVRLDSYPKYYSHSDYKIH